MLRIKRLVPVFLALTLIITLAITAHAGLAVSANKYEK